MHVTVDERGRDQPPGEVDGARGGDQPGLVLGPDPDDPAVFDQDGGRRSTAGPAALSVDLAATQEQSRGAVHRAQLSVLTEGWTAKGRGQMTVL